MLTEKILALKKEMMAVMAAVAKAVHDVNVQELAEEIKANDDLLAEKVARIKVARTRVARIVIVMMVHAKQEKMVLGTKVLVRGAVKVVATKVVGQVDDRIIALT